MQPILLDLELEVEEAAFTLGASRFQTLARIILPVILPALLTGFALAFARAVGEYGSIIFIAGNMPMVSEIAPLLIVIKLEQFDYAGAAAIGVVMLAASFVMLLVINLAQRWSRRWAVDACLGDCMPSWKPDRELQSPAARTARQSRALFGGHGALLRPAAGGPHRLAFIGLFLSCRWSRCSSRRWSKRRRRPISPPSPKPMRCRPSG